MRLAKDRQRRIAYDARNAQADKDAMSRLICQKFLEHPCCQQAETVMFYLDCRSEVRTRDWVREQLSGPPRRVVIPYCTQDADGQKKLGLWLLKDFQELLPGMWGILEPPQERRGEQGKEVLPEELDCIMVPGVAFDAGGGRLGNGVGYYDRLLKEVRKDTALIGVCYEVQMVSEVIMEPHDVYMDYIITEKKVYKGRERL